MPDPVSESQGVVDPGTAGPTPTEAHFLAFFAFFFFFAAIALSLLGLWEDRRGPTAGASENPAWG